MPGVGITAAADQGLTSQDGGTALLGGFTVDKSVEFSYEELARATNDFSMANKIGEGGFGVVYYAEIRGEVGYIVIILIVVFPWNPY